MLFALALSAQAADHAEAPGAAADPAADINDFFAWVDGDGSTYLIMTVQPFYTGPAADAYDRDVLYQVHYDFDGDGFAEGSMDVRFGPDGAGGWGVQAIGIPSGSGVVQGPVGSVITDGPTAIYAGITDDPFFFDLDGFLTTLGTGTVSFDSSNDSFAGANVLTIAIQTTDPGAPVQVWATTSRISGT